MQTSRATNLLNFIEEKERRERRKRLRWVAIGAAVLLLGGGGVAAGVRWMGQGAGLRTFQAHKLTRSQVITLFEQDKSPILVSYEQSSAVDTIHSPEEYTMYLASRAVRIDPAVEAQPVSLLEDESMLPAKVSGPLASADIMPAFPGGDAALYRFLSNQIRYPEKALRNKTEGKVYIRFVVQADGSITDLDVMRGIGHGCDQEALRVVQMMPRWTPGELAGQPVPVYSSLAIEFKFL